MTSLTHTFLRGRRDDIVGELIAWRFPHVRFDFRATDVVSGSDEIRFICPRCVVATTRRGERSWTRTSPRP